LFFSLQLPSQDVEAELAPSLSAQAQQAVSIIQKCPFNRPRRSKSKEKIVVNTTLPQIEAEEVVDADLGVWLYFYEMSYWW
jgi:hypothetical protein